MIVTRLRCEGCYKEFDYSFPIWCDICHQFISTKLCNICHCKKYHYEDFHYYNYEQRVKNIGGKYQE